MKYVEVMWKEQAPWNGIHLETLTVSQFVLTQIQLIKRRDMAHTNTWRYAGEPCGTSRAHTELSKLS
jgi:hypothetical protein